jgi:NADH:ubiquinone oxidoreductase subunit E
MSAPRLVSRLAVAVLVLAVAVLAVDYVRARMQAPRDAAAVATLQRAVEADRTAAPALAAEQDRITRARHSRKWRSNALATVAIVAAALFITGRKWEIAARGARPEGSRTNPDVRAKALTYDQGEHHPSGRVSVGQGFSPDDGGHRSSPDDPTIDLAAVDQLVATHGRTREAAIPILQGIQAHYRYLPDAALRRVCELTEVTPEQIAGTSTFYARFRRSPVGDHVVRVCHGTACHVSGARQITEELRRHLGIPEGSDTDPARRFTVDEVACIGCCSLAPVMMVDDRTAGRLTPNTAVAALALARETEPA